MSILSQNAGEKIISIKNNTSRNFSLRRS